MKTLADMRKALREMGFAVFLKSSRTGTFAYFRHNASTTALHRAALSSPDEIARWQPLLDWRAANLKTIEAICRAENITGLLPENAQ